MLMQPYPIRRRSASIFSFRLRSTSSLANPRYSMPKIDALSDAAASRAEAIDAVSSTSARGLYFARAWKNHIKWLFKKR